MEFKQLFRYQSQTKCYLMNSKVPVKTEHQAGFYDIGENDSRTFHSNMDFYDRIVPEYLIQGAVIVAGIVFLAAKQDEKLPRIENGNLR